MKPHGYGGKVLRVDLTTDTMVEEPTEKYAVDWVGGRGINEWILFNELDPECAPLSPEKYSATRVWHGPLKPSQAEGFRPFIRVK